MSTLQPCRPTFTIAALLLLAALASRANAAPPASAVAGEIEVAKVPASLAKSPEYSRYVSTLIQLELLANPAVAALPVTVVVPEPGVISLTGTVTSNKIRRFVIDTAKRISGLPVRDTMRIGPINPDYFVKVTEDRLETVTNETLASLFPELNEQVRTTVTAEGVVVLNGTAPTYEAKLTLSQAVKSQPGCKAVVNLIMVSADPGNGMVMVTDDGRMRLRANDLPTVPAAPLVNLERSDTDQPTVRALTAGPMADDAPDGDPYARQIRDDVVARLQRAPELAGAEFDVTVRGGEVTISSKLSTRAEVEQMVSVASDVSGVTKVIAKCSPFSIQRNIPPRGGLDAPTDGKAGERKKILGFLPTLGGPSGKEGKSLASDRRFRDTIKKTLKRRCDGRADDIAVRDTITGLQIEAEVKTPRDRTFVLKQIDNIVELRGVRYDVALHVKSD